MYIMYIKFLKTHLQISRACVYFNSLLQYTMALYIGTIHCLLLHFKKIKLV